jgi:membrane protease YdiL (CAAX protease family)
VKIPARALALLLLPFFLNDFAIVFLKLAVIPLTSLATFYHLMPWLGEVLAQWQPASVSVATYRQPLLWLQDGTVFVLIPGYFLIWALKKQLLDWESLGLGAKPLLGDFVYSLVLALQLFLISKFIRVVLLQFFPSWELFLWFSYDFPEGFPWKLLMILYACLSAAVVEELVFRGLLIPWLQSRGCSGWLSVVIAALLFAGIHWCQGPVQLVGTLAFGLVTGICFLTTRRLWPLILAHFWVDLIAFWPTS